MKTKYRWNCPARSWEKEMAEELKIARRQIAHGNQFPYDGGLEAAPASDWAHTAARGILADLLDRRGIKWELEKVEEDVRVDIVTALAAIVRAAAPSPSTAEDERAAFEAWAKGKGLIQESYGIRVVNTMCDLALDAWQARAALSANAADREATEDAGPTSEGVRP